MNKQIMNERKRDAVRIYRLLRENDIEVEDVIKLFPNFTIKEIESIYKEELFANLTKKYAKENNDYISRLFEGEKYPLNDNLVKEIYIFSKLSYFSIYILSKIFKVSESTIKRIKYGKSYRDITEEINVDSYKISKFIDKDKVIKETNILSEEEKIEIREKYLKRVKEESVDLTAISSEYNVSLNVISKIFKDCENKYDPRKLSDKKALNIYKQLEKDVKPYEIMNKYKISSTTLFNIKNKLSHKDVIERYEKKKK